MLLGGSEWKAVDMVCLLQVTRCCTVAVSGPGVSGVVQVKRTSCKGK